MKRMPVPAVDHSLPSTRFRKGQSGNPKGRPKSSRSPDQGSAFDIIIARTLIITQGAKTREVTVEEALQHKTYQQAIAGNRMARREVLKMIAKREKALAARPNRRKLVTLLHEHVDPRNAFEALRLLSIALPDPKWADPAREVRLLLAPWAVQAALNRRGLGGLSQSDVDDVNRSTFQPDFLIWPERLLP